MATNRIYLQIDVNSQNAQQNVNAVNNALANTGKAAEKSAQQTTGAMGRINVSIKQVADSFGGLGSALAGLGIARTVSEMVQLSGQVARIHQAMTMFTGSAQEAARVFEEIRSIARQSPFHYEDLEKTANALLGFGVAAKDVPTTVKAISDQVAAFGGSIEQVDKMATAFGRIMEKDFVGAMEVFRSLAQQGIPVMKVLRETLSKELGQALSDADVGKILEEHLLDPNKFRALMVRTMQGVTGGFGAGVNTAEQAFKNLSDAAKQAAADFFGPQGFGPALTHLAEELERLATPVAGLAKAMQNLPEATKEKAINIAAIAAAVAAFGVALGGLKLVVGPIIELTAALGGLAVTLLTLDPLLVIATGVIAGLGYVLYQALPGDTIAEKLDKLSTALAKLGQTASKLPVFQEDAIDKWVLGKLDALADKMGLKQKGMELGKMLGLDFSKVKIPTKDEAVKWFMGLLDAGKQKLAEFAKEGQKMIADILHPKEEPKADTGVLSTADQQAKYEVLLKKQKELADQSQKTLLEAFSSPAEAVALKYDALLTKLREDMLGLEDQTQRADLENKLRDAMTAETASALVKQRKQELDDLAKYQIEKVKGNTEIQIAYLEAQDARDLRTKVANLDKITDLRMQEAAQLAAIDKQRTQDELDDFVALAEAYRKVWEAVGVNVDDLIERHRQEALRKQAIIDEKAFDDAQKYRLEGWKRVNDAIIEDQKRVYDSFRDMFDQVFDAFTDKTQSIGKALGDMFKKLALGEIKETFSTMLAATATEAAGYGRPEEAVPQRGRGLVGILLRRGMPPRPPMSPPEAWQREQSESLVHFDKLEDSANVNALASGTFARAVDRYALLVEQQSQIDTVAGGPVGDYSEMGRRPGAGFGSNLWKYIRGGGGGAPPTPSPQVLEQIRQAADRYALDPDLMRAVAEVESSYNPNAVGPVTSSGARAKGLFQFMPATFRGYGGTNPFSAAQSSDAAGHYLSDLMVKYGGDMPSVLAEYNAGVVAMQKAGGIPSFTRPYIDRVMGVYNRLTASGAAPAAPVETPMVVPGGTTHAPVTLEELASLPTGPSPAAQMAQMMTLGLGPISGGAVTTVTPVTPPIVPGAATGSLLENLQKMGLGRLLGLGGAGAATAWGGGRVLGQMPGGESLARAAMGDTAASRLRVLFGIGTSSTGGTTLGSVLTSQAAGAVAGLAGMALLSKGLQQHYAPATTLGGGLAGLGFVMSNPQMMAKFAAGPGGLGAGLGAGAAAGAGLGLFMSGFQRGGGAGLAMDIGGGTLAGAGIGFMAGGPLGAAIGAGIGLAAGAITGLVRLFVHTKQEEIRRAIKQVYGIDISNRGILTQIEQIVNQQYGGSVSVGVRSQAVQDIVRLYALSTGQAAGLPRPMYSATFAQSTSGLALQPVYQGGQLVQNPYSGVTTYQYQSAVTQAEALAAQGRGPGSTFVQLNPQQANDLLTGSVVRVIQSNPSAVATASASAARSGDSRMTTTGAMMEPLTALS